MQDNYKCLYKLYLLLKNENHQSVVLYGNNALNIINDLIIILFTDKKTSIIENDITYSYNKYYYFFDMKTKKTKNLLDIISKISKTYNNYLNSNKYIIINNFFINCKIYSYFKNLLEKKNNIRFFFITEKGLMYDFCINIKCVRVIPKYNPYISIIKKLDAIYKDFSLESIKQFCFYLKCFTVNLNDFLKEILNYYLPMLNDETKIKLIKLLCDESYLITYSYKNIINLELIFINIYYILNDKLL
jgi:hypothetical protein